MATFNQLLRSRGIDPSEVALLRHQTVRKGRTPYWLWQNDPSGFLRYQSTQHDLPIFRKPYWASFVSPAKHETMFVGLFETEAQPKVSIDWLDPLSGRAVGEGRAKPYQYFRCALLPALEEQIGSLMIEWGGSLRQWTQYAANDDKNVVGGLHKQAVKSRAPTKNTQLGLQRTLRILGFAVAHRTQKDSMLRDAEGITLYIKNESERFPLVIHPYYDSIRREIETLPGITLDEARSFYINSNLSAFPIYRSPNRATTSRFGIALSATDAASIARLVTLLRENRTILTPLGPVEIKDAGSSKTTEREALCLARIGQGQFRVGCSQIWGWRCAVTGAAIQEVLRASHIKPWSKSNDIERLDPYNGLLLAAHVDALFDRHLISFSDNGDLLVSSRLACDELAKIGITLGDSQIVGVHEKHRPYLAQHRRIFYQNDDASVP